MPLDLPAAGCWTRKVWSPRQSRLLNKDPEWLLPEKYASVRAEKQIEGELGTVVSASTSGLEAQPLAIPSSPKTNQFWTTGPTFWWCNFATTPTFSLSFIFTGAAIIQLYLQDWNSLAKFSLELNAMTHSVYISFIRLRTSGHRQNLNLGLWDQQSNSTISPEQPGV